MNFGKRSQIWLRRIFSSPRRSILADQIQARMKAQTAMKTSMKTLTVVVVAMTHPG